MTADVPLVQGPGARRFPVSRIILIMAAVLSGLAMAPLVVSTVGLVGAVVADCALGSAVTCHWAGLDLKPLLIAAVSALQWSDLAWIAGSLAVVLWMVVFVRGLVRDVRLLRCPKLPGATSRLRRAYLLIPLTGATIVGFGPLGSVLWAAAFSGAFGCVVNEGAVHPCVVAGVDYGDALYQGFVVGWLMLLVWPLALLVLVGWVAVFGYVLSLLTRRARG